MAIVFSLSDIGQAFDFQIIFFYNSTNNGKAESRWPRSVKHDLPTKHLFGLHSSTSSIQNKHYYGLTYSYADQTLIAQYYDKFATRQKTIVLVLLSIDIPPLLYMLDSLNAKSERTGRVNFILRINYTFCGSISEFLFGDGYMLIIYEK
uniref:Uncharacterized protein n=1 Tax=Elaeophora elaphi TaxID=1147741 RepID=A0A0R3RVM0_9BILA